MPVGVEFISTLAAYDGSDKGVCRYTPTAGMSLNYKCGNYHQLFLGFPLVGYRGHRLFDLCRIAEIIML